MDPEVLNGVRKSFTDLDWAALQDIGWQVAPTILPDIPPLVLVMDVAFALALALPAVGGGEVVSRLAHEFSAPRVGSLRRTSRAVMAMRCSAAVATCSPSGTRTQKPRA